MKLKPEENEELLSILGGDTDENRKFLWRLIGGMKKRVRYWPEYGRDQRVEIIRSALRQLVGRK